MSARNLQKVIIEMSDDDKEEKEKNLQMVNPT